MRDGKFLAYRAVGGCYLGLPPPALFPGRRRGKEGASAWLLLGGEQDVSMEKSERTGMSAILEAVPEFSRNRRG
ncbi:hypothetical protein BON30_00865 [Cystobacter ferrugineus]|uniref:Uncharacterized protein n=1 Tax=Cystobacter ferrugineus TaxID=83449 RepID=A0A1L9BHT3_9BACT|nr:hypothetical protein BON30_00865 [Cystobacter ferrugineus]